MFYLLKRVDEKQFTPGERVMVLADFPAVGLPAGTIADVVEVYDRGIMIEWDRAQPNGGYAKEREGFGRDDLEYLAVQTRKHPQVS